MTRYKITVNETLTYEGEVEANTKEAAEELAVTADFISDKDTEDAFVWFQKKNNTVVTEIEEVVEEEGEEGEEGGVAAEE